MMTPLQLAAVLGWLTAAALAVAVLLLAQRLREQAAGRGGPSHAPSGNGVYDGIDFRSARKQPSDGPDGPLSDPPHEPSPLE